MDSKKLIIGLVVALALVGCGSTKPITTTSSSSLPSGSATSPLLGTAQMQIDNFTTTPQTIFVKKDTILTITNKDVTGHSVTADNGSFDTGVLGKGKSATVTLNTIGTITFHCTPHPSTQTLKGTITVVE